MKTGRTNLKPIEVKPLRFYQEQDIDIDNIDVGDVVIARVCELIDNTIILNVSGTEATMELEDYSYYAESKTIKSVFSLIGRNALVRVKSKDENKLILERKTIEAETIEILKSKINDVVDATIEYITTYGFFVDIGNGVPSLIPAKEVSTCRYDFLNTFSKGEKVKVKILDYVPENSHFFISRKQAYERINFERNTVIDVVCSTPLSDGTGIYVEYDPGNPGIMDIPRWLSSELFEEGSRVKVVVKKMTNAGFKCRYHF